MIRGRTARSAIAGGLSLSNALLGLACLVLLSQAHHFALPELIGWVLGLMLAAALIDGIDGTVARTLGVTGATGRMLDSLCDAVTFGAVPALAILQVGIGVHDVAGRAGVAVSGFLAAIHLSCTLLRLARFSAEAPREGPGRDGVFVGLPGPAAALWIVATLSLALDYAIPFLLVLPLQVLVAVLMVSPLPYLHGRRLLRAAFTHMPATVLGGVGLAGLGLAIEDPVVPLTIGLAAYLSLGPAGGRTRVAA